MKNSKNYISAHEILMKHCHSLHKDLRVPRIIQAMAEFALLKMKQQREFQKPNIKLVNHANYPNNEFSG
jgi:hypothetical protein